MQILAYVLSESFEIDFVLETVNLLLSNYGQTLDCETLIHSDQGCHYTSKKFRQIVKDAELRHPCQDAETVGIMRRRKASSGT